jgi:ribosomal protein S18 acetylase RimI-like enzyme
MDHQVSVREARIEDLQKVADLFNLYRQFYGQPSNLTIARQFLSDRFTKGESLILVANSVSDHLVGFCQLYPMFCSVEAAPIYSLYDLFVLPVARKLGVGRLLLNAAEDQARKHGKVRMDLTTARTNLAAQSLYESDGWMRDEIFFAYSKRVTGCK